MQPESGSVKMCIRDRDMDGVMVGTQIEKIHNEYISVIQYHNEKSLSSVLTIAYPVSYTHLQRINRKKLLRKWTDHTGWSGCIGTLSCEEGSICCSRLWKPDGADHFEYA